MCGGVVSLQQGPGLLLLYLPRTCGWSIEVRRYPEEDRGTQLWKLTGTWALSILLKPLFYRQKNGG